MDTSNLTPYTQSLIYIYPNFNFKCVIQAERILLSPSLFFFLLLFLFFLPLLFATFLFVPFSLFLSFPSAFPSFLFLLAFSNFIYSFFFILHFLLFLTFYGHHRLLNITKINNTNVIFCFTLTILQNNCRT